MTDPASPWPRFDDLVLDGALVRFGVRVDDAANRAAVAYAEAVRAETLPGVEEVAIGPVSVLVRIDPLASERAVTLTRLRDLLAARDWPRAAPPPGRRLWTVPASFEGDDAPQLAEAAALAGCTMAEAIATLTAEPLRVLSLGFAPGQPYLGTLPEAWDLPRQAGLTPQVPAGAITVAVRQIVLFANLSPTGWRQVGRCAFRLYRPGAEDPFPLRPGDLVRFLSVSPAALAEAEARPDGGAVCEAAS